MSLGWLGSLFTGLWTIHYLLFSVCFVVNICTCPIVEGCSPGDIKFLNWCLINFFAESDQLQICSPETTFTMNKRIGLSHIGVLRKILVYVSILENVPQLHTLTAGCAISYHKEWHAKSGCQDCFEEITLFMVESNGLTSMEIHPMVLV